MSRTLFTTLTILILAAAGGCNSNSTSALETENVMLLEENETLRAQLMDRSEALDSTSAELRDRNIQVSELQREVDDLLTRPAPQPVAATTTTGFEGIQGVSGSFGAGEVTATVDSDILFDSGKSTLRSNAKRSLDAVADVLRSSYSGRTIKVAGHTDTDPIRKSGYKSNHHLGFERGYAVREYLVSRGVGSDRIFLASHGPNEPRGTKSESRRVEIVVLLN